MLRRILVPVMGQSPQPATSAGMVPVAASQQEALRVPLGELADIKFTRGPTVIKSEEGLLSAYVYVDISGVAMGSYVNEAKKSISSLKMPPGYRLQWSGEYEYLVKTESPLRMVVPLTILIIFVLIYFNTKSVTATLIVLSALPFSLVGSFWFLYILGCNLSIAVWAGIIALAGLAAETGVVKMLYLEPALECAHTGFSGDGIITVSPVERLTKIRTKEKFY